MVRRQKLNNAADDFFENTTKDWLPRPQPIDFVLDYFTNKEGGVFVDVGAYDGVSCSNTFVLENKMKWNGICVEPSLDAYKECEKNRSCPTFNLAISSQKKVFLRKVTGAASCLSCVIGVADHNPATSPWQSCQRRTPTATSTTRGTARTRSPTATSTR